MINRIQGLFEKPKVSPHIRSKVRFVGVAVLIFFNEAVTLVEERRQASKWLSQKILAKEA